MLQIFLDELAEAQSLSQQLTVLMEAGKSELSALSGYLQDELGHLENLALDERAKLLEMGAKLHAEFQNLQTELPNAAGLLEQLAMDIETLHGTLGSAVAAVRQQAHTFVDELASQQQQSTSLLNGLQQDVTNLQAQMSATFALSATGLQTLSAVISTEQAQWAQLIVQASGDLQMARQTLAAHLDAAFSGALDQTLQKYGGALAELDQNALRNPLGTLQDEARQEIEQVILRAFDTGLAQLVQLVQQFGERIAGSSDRTDAENRALDEVLQKLEAFAGPLTEGIGGVEQVASIVGVDI